MKALLVKDFCLIVKSCRIYVLVLLIYLAVSLFSGTDFGIIMAVLSGMLPITLYALDERAQWDCFAQTFPITRKTAVGERYVMAILLAFLGMVLGSLISVSATIKNGGTVLSALSSNGAGFLFACLFSSLGLPIIIKMGTEKARMALLLSFGIPVLGGTLIMKGFEDGTLAPMMDSMMKWLPIASVGIVGILMAISYGVSLRLYAKKDL